MRVDGNEWSAVRPDPRMPHQGSGLAGGRTGLAGPRLGHHTRVVDVANAMLAGPVRPPAGVSRLCSCYWRS